MGLQLNFPIEFSCDMCHKSTSTMFTMNDDRPLFNISNLLCSDCYCEFEAVKEFHVNRHNDNQ